MKTGPLVNRLWPGTNTYLVKKKVCPFCISIKICENDNNEITFVSNYLGWPNFYANWPNFGR